jgi:hypothetical protein
MVSAAGNRPDTAIVNLTPCCVSPSDAAFYNHQPRINMTNNQEHQTEHANLPEDAANAIHFAIEHGLLSAALQSLPETTLSDVTGAIIKAIQYDAIREAFQSLSDEGGVVDSGEKVWNEDMKTHEIVWISTELATKH